MKKTKIFTVTSIVALLAVALVALTACGKPSQEKYEANFDSLTELVKTDSGAMYDFKMEARQKARDTADAKWQVRTLTAGSDGKNFRIVSSTSTTDGGISSTVSSYTGTTYMKNEAGTFDKYERQSMSGQWANLSGTVAAAVITSEISLYTTVYAPFRLMYADLDYKNEAFIISEDKLEQISDIMDTQNIGLKVSSFALKFTYDGDKNFSGIEIIMVSTVEDSGVTYDYEVNYKFQKYDSMTEYKVV